MYKVLIVIPTFNESESVAQLIQRIDKMRDLVSNQYHLDVLVVDDNSPDGTADLVNEAKYRNVFVLSQDNKKWFGLCLFSRLSMGFDAWL